MRTENERFFRAAKPNAQNSIDNLIMIRVFQIVFGQQVSQILVLNSGRMVAPCGTRIKRFREIFASSLDYMGLVAPEHLSPCRSSMVLAKRETQHIRFTLGGLSLGVLFSSRWLCRSRSSTASYLPYDGYPPRPRRGEHCGCATPQLLS